MKVVYTGEFAPHDAVDVEVPEGSPVLPTGGVVTVKRDEPLDVTPAFATRLLEQACWSEYKPSKKAAQPAEGEGD